MVSQVHGYQHNNATNNVNAKVTNQNNKLIGLWTATHSDSRSLLKTDMFIQP